jgi:cyclic-di-GMP phosphodiesterase, flagellum assembly factor TipF
MARIKKLITTLLVVFSVLAVGVALWQFSGFSNVEMTVVLACLLLGLAQLSSYMSREKEHDENRSEIEELAATSMALKRELQDTKSSIKNLESYLDASIRARNEKIIAQIKSLEDLVKEMAKSKNKEQASRQAENTASAETTRAQTAKEQSIDEKLLSAIRKSIAENKIDLYLQPIVTLPQRKTSYYEEFTQLRAPTHGLLAPASYVGLAEQAGLMPTINNLTLFRSVQILRKLKQRNAAIGLFCNISVKSLSDAAFFPQFMEFLEDNKDLNSSLFFEFSQPMLAQSGPLEKESLNALAKSGFGFSMDHVDDLNIDFQELRELNFRFLKLDQNILLNRMEEVNSPIQGEDLNALLKRHGIELIIEKINDERTVANILDYDVSLGQGALFSEPRPVLSDVSADRQQTQSATG